MTTSYQTLAATAETPPDCPPGPPPRLKTLVEITRWRAEKQARDVAFTFLVDGEQQEENLTYAALDRRARAIAAELQARGAGGERVLLLFNPGLDFNAAVFGCLYAGAVAVPAYPPDPFRAGRTLPRLAAIIDDAQARFVLGSQEILQWARGALGAGGRVEILALEAIPETRAEDWRPFEPSRRQPALLQYTSGSTGTPRGVILSHANLMHNLAAMHRLDIENAVVVCWVPPYHDMGLIGGIVLPVHSGRRMVLMSPLAFMQRPARWLWAMSRYRACTTPSPNFGYELCLRKVRAEECEGLDLSSWRVAINGAEPVRADTIDRFVEAFGRYGFRREAFYPAFGMAESALLVAGGRRGDAPLVTAFSARAMHVDRVEEAEPDDPTARRLVGCGQPMPDSEIAIVDPQLCLRLPVGEVGEIWVHSPSVGLGYWNRPEETERVFRARLDGENGRHYLRTGDLGFLCRGQLFVTGRLKEMIILAGRKYYSQDIELAAQRSHPALKPDGGAAFSVEAEGEEQLVVVHEVLRPKRYDLDEVLRKVRAELAEEHELTPHVIALISAGSLPKTSSGKTQRRACREKFLRGDLQVLALWRADKVASLDGACAGASDPPQTPVETVLARLWQQVLGTGPVGRNDDFLALGGHSLRAAQLAGRISDEFDVDVPLKALFERPTVAALGAWIETVCGDASRPDGRTRRKPIPRRKPDAPAVLSSAEQRLWFFDQLEPSHPFYNMPVAARMFGPLDEDVFERSLHELVRRHETLRTSFPANFGRPVRRIAPVQDDLAPAPLRRVDLSALPKGERENELRRQLRAEGRAPFDLARGPLLRCVLYRLGQQEHVVLLAMHHIAADGWSIGVMVRELGLVYDALLHGRPSPLPPLAIQYADFAAWQQQVLPEVIQRDLPYWSERLGSGPVPLELPFDRPRPARQSFEGAWRPFQLPSDLSARISELARGERATLLAVLMAGCNVLLSRYCRQDDVAVGTITANRVRPELEPLVGFFANTLVLRTDVSGDPTFRELIARVGGLLLDGFSHQELPFEKLVELLDPARPRNQAPLFQVALVLENMPLEFPANLGLRTEPIPVDNGTSKYDLALLVSETATGLAGHVEYCTALFDEATIDRMVRALGTLLAAAVRDPDCPISRLPLIDAAECRRAVADFQGAEADVPPLCLHGLFEEHAKHTPERAAIREDGREWTYGEVDRQANRVARRLRARGVGPEQPVAVCIERSARHIIAMLGVLKAGGAYVPLDPHQPAERTAMLLDDVCPRVVLAERRFLEGLPQTDAEIVPIEDLCADSDPEAPASEPAAVDPRHLAYIIFTSGSTGRPKGVLIEHRSVVSFVRAFSRALNLDADCRALNFFSPSSDGSISDTFSALANGGCLVVASYETVKSADALEELLRQEHVTVATLTPSMLATLRPANLPGLTTVCSVGEAISADVVARWAAGRRLINGYGLTETAVGACLAECSAGVSGTVPIFASAKMGLSPLTRRPGTVPIFASAKMGLSPSTPLPFAPATRPPIGRPLDNVRVYLLDPRLEPVPIGVPGEICIGGVQVGRGYLKRPELTAERFVPDPFDDRPGARLYRTGDLGRRRPDGAIDFLGRVDDQVKLRGHRVELGEIESVLEGHSGVGQAAVVLRQDQPGQQRLVAYVTSSAAGAAAALEERLGSQLRSYLRSRLPDFMVPSALVLLDALPRTVQGKVDRRALPAPSGDRCDGLEGYVAPRDEQETLVASVWEELLDVRPVGVADNFFDLGGHSLLAVRVMAEIQRRSARRLPLTALFQEATVEHLARLLREPETSCPENSLVPLQTQGAGRPFFCLHPAGGTVFCYRTLADRLGRQRPFYGIQAMGIDGTHEPHRRVDDMVAHYIAAIRSVQSQGPYMLGGWSLGGNLAFETARQMAEQGEQIGLLALFDAAPLHADREPSQEDFLPMVMALFPEEVNLPLEEVQAMTPTQQLEYFLERAAQAEIVPAAVENAVGRQVFDVFRASMQAILDYRQKPYPGKLTVFVAEHREGWLGTPRDAQLGWGQWAQGGVEAHRIPGGHIRMVLEPSVGVLAEALRQCLDRADPVP